MPGSLLPLLIVAHVWFAVGLFVPSILLPFALRPRRGAPGGDVALETSRGRFVRALLVIQARGTVVIGTGLVVTGVALVAILGLSLATQPWLLVALAIYVGDLVLALFIQRPNLRRMIGIGSGADERWKALARRQRYVSYVMAGLVGAIAVLMSTKPRLW